MENKTSDRTRNWTFILYPESAPKDWQEILNTMGLTYVISPLHDKDIDKDGKPKKPHYHIVLTFDGKKSYAQVKEITDSINCTIPQKVQNMRGCIRYLGHIDNPEKAQYDITKIKAVGVDVEKYLYTAEEEKQRRLKAIKEMFKFISEQGLTELTHILDYASDNEPYWFELLCSDSAYVVNCYLKSKRYELEKLQKTQQHH